MIATGRNRTCKDLQGGIYEVFIFPFVKYSRSQIVSSGNVLTDFPETTIYPFYSLVSPTPSQQMEQDAGGKFYNQSISLEFDSYNEVEKLLNKDYRIIFKDRLGNYRIFGLYNGLESGTLNYTTGGGKTDLNGYKISFDGKEEREAYFINNLASAGFIIDGTETNEYLLQENGDFLLQQNGFKIIL